jgi:hypothetical protein
MLGVLCIKKIFIEKHSPKPYFFDPYQSFSGYARLLSACASDCYHDSDHLRNQLTGGALACAAVWHS